ncbi:MAG TPA: hypothetical protein PLM71_02130 [Syntrophorhabdaceae bacterium]|nr:hypothetical protein [Syntrophorhabdaceae bacterium]
MENKIVIDKRFCGPSTSGNGGYVCGLLASFIDSPGAIVRLLKPIPLDTELEIQKKAWGIILVEGDTVLAVARPSRITFEPPLCPDYKEVKAASEKYRGFISHWFPDCFVCGPHRGPGDGLRIFPGPIEGSDLIGCPWIPDASLASKSNSKYVSTEFIWAILDCPGAFTFPEPVGEVILLGELQAEILKSVSIGERCVIVAREITHKGRKHHTVTALYGESGACCAIGIGTFLTASI